LPTSHSTTDLDLHRLWTTLELARTKHREQLAGRDGSSNLVLSTRYDTLIALEDYAAALESHHVPIPPSVNRDLRLLRGLCSHATTRSP
jgi:hypothetical protein